MSKYVNLSEQLFPVRLPNGVIVYRKILADKTKGICVRVNKHTFYVEKWDKAQEDYPYTCALTFSYDGAEIIWAKYNDGVHNVDTNQVKKNYFDDDFFKNVRK